MKTHKARTFLHAEVLLAVAVTGGNLAHAQSCNVSWTGNAGNGAWSTAGNWTTNQDPVQSCWQGRLHARPDR